MPSVFSINIPKSGNYSNPTLAIDVNDNVYVVYQFRNESPTDGKIYLSKIKNTEPLEIEDYEIVDCYVANSGPTICSNHLNIILISYSNYCQGEADIYISVYDSINNSWNKDIPITKNVNKDEAWSSMVNKDNDGNFHLIWRQLNDWGLFYSKINSNGMILLNKRNLTSEYPVYPENIKLDSEGYLNILYRSDGFKYLKIDQNGEKQVGTISMGEISSIPIYPIVSDNNNNLLYLDDNGIVDSHNNIHIITMGYSSNDTSSNAFLFYSKLNRTGTKLIENKTIATHDKKKEYDHGPAIFDPKVAIDSEDNIHITWYINDGGNHFSVWYEKIDPNGTVFISAMKIAPEDDEESTPGFEVGPLLMVIGIMVIWYGRRERKCRH